MLAVPRSWRPADHRDPAEAVLAVYRKPPTPTHKIAAHLALCATQDPKLIQRTIDFTFTDEVRAVSMR